MSKIKAVDGKSTDEKHEKNLRILERYFIGRDDSGHSYIVPIARKIEFDKWSESEDSDPDLFNEYRFNGGFLTFTDPRIN